MPKYLLLFLIFPLIFLVFFLTNNNSSSPTPLTKIQATLPSSIFSSPTPPKITLLSPPFQKTLQSSYHIFETFNNCGPATLSMTLSYYGIKVSQQDLGQALRPYQVPRGDNDDKSVTLEELAQKAKEYNLVPFHRPNGDFEKIKLFITYDIPVIVRTVTKVNEDIGHFRIVKGFDENTKQIIQDDSLQGKNLKYSYSDFDTLWKKFNYEYLILVPLEKVEIVETILGDDKDEKKSWTKAVELSKKQLAENPEDIYARFNLSVAYYNIGEYQKSTAEFEKVEKKLPFRTLWYQIEPIQAYYQLGDYDRVFEITDKVLNNANRAFSELYLLRGEIYKKQGKLNLAKSEFEKAVLYNTSLKSAQEALNSI